MSEYQTPRPNMHEPDLRDDVRATPPGWYDDGQSRLTWWDGERWTSRHQPLPEPDPAASAPPERPTAPLWVAIVLPLVTLVAGIALGAAIGASG